MSRRAALAQIAAGLGALLLPRHLRADKREPFPHPDPRPGITAEKVLPDSELGDSRSVKEAYATARAHPEVFDGLYCVCECDVNMKHRSLLACFESEQAKGCWSCREQAKLVASMRAKEQDLAAIRKAFDEKWGD